MVAALPAAIMLSFRPVLQTAPAGAKPALD